MGDFESILARVRVTPPTCIIDAEPRLEPSDNSGNDNSLHISYRIGCRCSGRSNSILCYPTKIQREIVILSPLALQCSACNGITEFFDSDRHGYDPEVCGDSATMTGSGSRQLFSCTTCAHKLGQVITTFSFNGVGELFEDLPEALRGREQDVFDWFTVEFECDACGKRDVVADFERA